MNNPHIVSGQYSCLVVMLAGDVEVKAGFLIVGDGRLLEDAHVGVSKGVIKEISEEKLKGKYGESIDLSDRYVMPGLVDAHVHNLKLKNHC